MSPIMIVNTHPGTMQSFIAVNDLSGIVKYISFNSVTREKCRSLVVFMQTL